MRRNEFVERDAFGLGNRVLSRAPRGDTNPQPDTEVAQGVQDLADLCRLLTLFDFGDPGLGRSERTRKLGLCELVMPARRGDDLAHLRGGLCPHAGDLCFIGSDHYISARI